MSHFAGLLCSQILTGLWPNDSTAASLCWGLRLRLRPVSRCPDRACSAQGINRLGLVFQQLVIASLAVSTVTTLEAAAKWPDLVWLASALFFGVAGARVTSSFAPDARAYITLCV